MASAQPNHETTNGAGPTSPATPVAELERLIPLLMEEHRVPGVSIALIKNAQLFWRRGFGVKDRSSQAPVDHDTVFEAASVSKTVFAYAALKLCERGVIGLDTPLTKYAAKPFLEGDPQLERITARHVLSHTTGFPPWRSRAQPLKINFPPGERYSYSGEGYSYLQSVISQLTGRVSSTDSARFEADVEVFATDIADYMKANLFEPFDMTSSGYLWSDRWEKHAARPHDAEGKPLTKARPRATEAARYAAAGGLNTTPTDYAKFLIEVLAPKPSDAFRLNAASLQEMVRPHVKVDDSHSWALGWQIIHTKQGDLIQHGGNQSGFHAWTAASLKNKSGFVIMTNADNGWQLNQQVFDQVMMRYLVG